MADIPSYFSGISPPTSSSNIITKVLPGVAGLSEGSLLNAIVLRHDANGNPVLGTKGGELTIATRLILASDSALVLKILSATPLAAPQVSSAKGRQQVRESNFRAQVISVDGKQPQPAALPPQTSSGQPSVPTPTSQENFDIVRAVPTPAGGQAKADVSSQTGQAPVVQQSSSASTQNDASVVRISNGAQTSAVVITPSGDAGKYLPAQTTVPQAKSSVPAPVLHSSD